MKAETETIDSPKERKKKNINPGYLKIKKNNPLEATGVLYIPIT